jgi:predicted nucleotide-binding protein (sugar kinase/HSP70/actin superfamily)
MQDKVELFLREMIKKRIEKNLKKRFAKSGLYEYEEMDIDKVLEHGSKFVNKEFTGESILVVGSFFHEIAKHVHGMISIGPFGCLPSRVVESILSQESKVHENERLKELDDVDHIHNYHTLPFLSIESDGNPFPQIIESRIEAFCLQVERIHKEMLDREN